MRQPIRSASTVITRVQPAAIAWSLGACLVGALIWAGAPAHAQATAGKTTTAARSQPVVVSQAWVRPTVKGQQGTGGYLQIQAQEAVTLVGLASPVAGKAELHEMKMDGDVMRMRALAELPIAAGETAALKPGGNHLMLLDLKRPIDKGSLVPLTLKFKGANGQAFDVQVSAMAQVAAPAASGGQAKVGGQGGKGHHGDHHDHGGHDHHNHKH